MHRRLNRSSPERVALTDAPYNPARLDGVDTDYRFEVEGGLSLTKCRIPIPNTGLDVTGINGRVKLFAGLTEVRIGLDVASQFKLKDVPVVSAQRLRTSGRTTIHV